MPSKEPTLPITFVAVDLSIEADIGPEHADTFRSVQHPDLRADYVLANPPFNPASRGTNIPRSRSAKFIHCIRRNLGEGGHLAPKSMAGFHLASGPAVTGSSNESGEDDIRRAPIVADLVDCMVALPGQLFYGVAKCFMPCRMIHWIKRLNILGSLAEIRSQGAHTSASLKIEMPFSPVIAAQLS